MDRFAGDADGYVVDGVQCLAPAVSRDRAIEGGLCFRERVDGETLREDGDFAGRVEKVRGMLESSRG